MDQFPRISRFPPYVFNIVNELKAKARAAGEDIIDFGMGNGVYQLVGVSMPHVGCALTAQPPRE